MLRYRAAVLICRPRAGSDSVKYRVRNG
jgi:hypothetical protein